MPVEFDNTHARLIRTLAQAAQLGDLEATPEMLARLGDMLAFARADVSVLNLIRHHTAGECGALDRLDAMLLPAS